MTKMKTEASPIKVDKLGMPEDLPEALKALLETGIEWGATAPQTDRDHIKDFERTLKATRDDHGMPRHDVRALHGVYLKGTVTVVCHTGISPNSALHARLITGAITSLPDVLETSIRLREALEMAQATFLEYEQHHLAKGTEESNKKAARNAELAETMRTALDWRAGGKA